MSLSFVFLKYRRELIMALVISMLKTLIWYLVLFNWWTFYVIRPVRNICINFEKL